MDEADRIMNADSPVVQDCEDSEFIEIVWPKEERVMMLHETVAMSMCAEILGTVTGHRPEH